MGADNRSLFSARLQMRLYDALVAVAGWKDYAGEYADESTQREHDEDFANAQDVVWDASLYLSGEHQGDASHYARVEDTTWPVNVGETGWRLRYAPDRADPLFAASIVSAYAALTDPAITQAQAVASLKRAREAAASA